MALSVPGAFLRLSPAVPAVSTHMVDGCFLSTVGLRVGFRVGFVALSCGAVEYVSMTEFALPLQPLPADMAESIAALLISRTRIAEGWLDGLQPTITAVPRAIAMRLLFNVAPPVQRLLYMSV